MGKNQTRGVGRRKANGRPAPKGTAAPGEYPKVYTAQDIGRILKVNVETIYRKQKKGELPKPMSFSRILRWNGRLFDKWVEGGCPKMKARRKRKAAEGTPPGAGKKTPKGKQGK